jgi:hypothetical protein
MIWLAEVAEWQTRRSQKPLGKHPCGFESHLRHQGLRGRHSAPGAAVREHVGRLSTASDGRPTLYSLELGPKRLEPTHCRVV